MQIVSFLATHDRFGTILQCRETGDIFQLVQRPNSFAVVSGDGFILSEQSDRFAALDYIEQSARLSFLTVQSHCGHYAVE